MFILSLAISLILMDQNIVLTCTDCEAKLEQILAETQQCKSDSIVGLSVSVVQSNKVLFQGGYGVKRLRSNESVTADTVFGLASLSKAFASTLLLKLIEEKMNYSLDTKVSTVLDKHDLFYDLIRSKYATLRDLLSHRMGIPGNNRIRMNNNLTRANLVERLKYLKPAGGFRDSYFYSNLMYGLVTYITEQIGGDSWENLVRNHLFTPLGMKSSTFMTEVDPDKIDLAHGYVEYYGELKPVPFNFSRHWAILCGSGCVMSTSHDMTNWMKVWLNGGKLPNGKRLISEKAYNHLIRAENIIDNSYTQTYFQKPVFPVTNSQTSYALGWRRGFYRGYDMIVHSGTTFGYRALLSVFPDNDLAIFTVMTGNDPSYLYRQTLHNFIFDLYNRFEPYLNSSSICYYPEPWKNTTNSKSKPKYNEDLQPGRTISEYFGTYHNVAYGNLEIKAHGDSNKLILEYGIQTCWLYPKKKKDEFFGNSIGLTKYIINFETFMFSFNDDVVSLKIPVFERKDPPIFTKSTKKETNSSNCVLPLDIFCILCLIFINFLIL